MDCGGVYARCCEGINETLSGNFVHDGWVLALEFQSTRAGLNYLPSPLIAL